MGLTDGYRGLSKENRAKIVEASSCTDAELWGLDSSKALVRFSAERLGGLLRGSDREY